MYNYTYYEPLLIKNKPPNTIDKTLLLTCIGAIFYSLCAIYNIDPDAIIQNRRHKFIFNILLLMYSSISLIKLLLDYY